VDNIKLERGPVSTVWFPPDSSNFFYNQWKSSRGVSPFYTGPLYISPDYVDDFDLRNSQITDIYDAFDDLMSEHSYCMTKTLLGHGSGSDGTPSLDLPVYEYVINNPKSTLMLNTTPVILITASVHGDEKNSTWSLFCFLQDMLNNVDNNPLLTDIKSSVTFKIIPIVNPGGYNAMRRNTNTGVNLNRNFGYRWETQTDSDKGAFPYSEPETCIVRDWVNANNNAFALIDFHAFDPTVYKPTPNSLSLTYADSLNDDMYKAHSHLTSRLSLIWREKYSFLADMDYVAYGYKTHENKSFLANDAYATHGIRNSLTLEVAHSETSVRFTFTKGVIERGVDVLANFVLDLLYKYRVQQ